MNALVKEIECLKAQYKAVLIPSFHNDVEEKQEEMEATFKSILKVIH